MDWLLSMNIKEENTRFRDHTKEELSHYSKATTDIEYKFPFGWGELWGIANRTDFDLKQHMEYSKEDLSYFDPVTNEKYIPYCIEPSLGADRVTLAILCEAYEEEEIGQDDVRTVLRFHPAVAPVKIAVLPLSKSLARKLLKFIKNCPHIMYVNMTKREASAKDTADRMRLVHLIVLLMILIHWKIKR